MSISGVGSRNTYIFAEGQWSSVMLEMNDRLADNLDRSDLMGGTTPMLLELLRQLGVDTDREFTLNGTKRV